MLDVGALGDTRRGRTVRALAPNVAETPVFTGLNIFSIVQSLNKASRHDWTPVSLRPTLGIFPKGVQGPRHEPHFCRQRPIHR